jgi:hypothetical protein
MAVRAPIFPPAATHGRGVTPAHDASSLPPVSYRRKLRSTAKCDGPRWGGAGAVWPVRLGGEESDRAGTA